MGFGVRVLYLVPRLLFMVRFCDYQLSTLNISSVLNAQATGWSVKFLISL
jgi:hypothetical protein